MWRPTERTPILPGSVRSVVPTQRLVEAPVADTGVAQESVGPDDQYRGADISRPMTSTLTTGAAVPEALRGRAGPR